MAKAIAICTCKVCGSTFKKETTKQNRHEADSWEEWAKNEYVLCPHCWGEQQRKEESEKPLTLVIGCNPYAQEIVISFAGNTMPAKEQIKSLGYRWGETPMQGWGGLFSMRRPPLCWHKSIKLEELESEMESIKNTFPEIDIKNNVSDVDVAFYQQVKATKDEKEKAVNDALSSTVKPQMPECYPAGKWNGKFYGKKGSFSVYSDGNKIELTDEQVSEIENYVAAKAEYKKKVEEIKNAI